MNPFPRIHTALIILGVYLIVMRPITKVGHGSLIDLIVGIVIVALAVLDLLAPYVARPARVAPPAA